MKSIKKNSILLIIFSCLVIFLAIKDDFETTVKAFQNTKYLWIVIALIAMLIFWAIKSLALHVIVKKYPKKTKFTQIFRQIIITQFFNGITPFATGGQPMQVYMLSKTGLSLAQTTNIIIQDFIIYQIALVFLTTVAVIMNSLYQIFPDSLLLKKLIIIGYLVNLGVAIVLIFISFSTKVTKKVAVFFIKLFSKLKIIKKYKEKLDRIEDKIDEFHEGVIILRKNKKTIALGLFYNTVGLLIYFAIPIFIFKAVDSSISTPLLEMLVASAYVTTIAAFVPTPGGTGGIEYSFLDFFKKFVTYGRLSAIMLIWRFVTYHFGIIVGGILFSLTGDDNNENRTV